MIGGYSFEESEFNRAFQACRQPGSAFKPVVALAALAFSILLLCALMNALGWSWNPKAAPNRHTP